MIIDIVNNKGGTGKTTTCVNLSAALTLMGYRVLVVDCDSQASATISLGYKNIDGIYTIADMFFSGTDIEECIEQTALKNLYLVPGDIEMANCDIALADVAGREKILRTSLANVKAEYDFIILDSPPSLSLAFVNSLVACDYYIVPIIPEYLAVSGFKNLLTAVNKVEYGMKVEAKMLGIVFTMVNPSKIKIRKAAVDVINQIRNEYKEKIFNTMIPHSEKLNEAVLNSVSIYDYAPHSVGARLYMDLAKEIVSESKMEIPEIN